MTPDQITNGAAAKAPEYPWLTEMVRITAFPMPGMTLVPKRWNEIFAGEEPDQILRQPTMPHLEGGPFNGDRLSISHSPARFDMVVSPTAPSTPSTELLHIEDLDVVFDRLLIPAKHALKPDAPIQRIALGAVRMLPISAVRDSHEVFKRFVPQITNIPDNATDLAFQINIPVLLNDPIPTLVVNRLLKLQDAAIQLLGVTPAPTSVVPVMPTRFAVRLELDINTAAERPNPLPNDLVPELLTKLVGIVKTLIHPGALQ
jgi:hypothetical protein